MSITNRYILSQSVTLNDAQIKALPTTAIQFLPAPPLSARYKVFGATFAINTAAGAYTNVNATYAVLGIGSPDMATGWWPCNPLLNDSSVDPSYPALVRVTNFLTVAHARTADLGAPVEASYQGWISGPSSNYPTTDVQAFAVQAVSMDNNGSGNLTGGHANNTLKVTVYYVVEPL